MEDHIRVTGDLSSLRGTDIKIERKLLGYSGVPFDNTVSSHFDNTDLIQKLMDLNDNGVLFGEDYKQLYCPASFMRELQIKGILKTAFKSIYWKGPQDWHTRENNVEQAR